jgi:tetratricopeptide (TPR) repeat protein
MSTLGLNIIVGPGEAKLLKRCLDSFDAKNSFDEIVIVNTSLDDAINQVAKEYTNNIFYYAWETEEHPFGDFGGARDHARKNSTADKIMWLDTDDVCLKEYKEKWVKTIALVKNDAYKDVILWSMPYAIVVNDKGEPVTWFKRERIFDREKIEWRRPIHELMFPEWEMVKNAEINGMFITHLPMKPTFSSASRNVKILEHEYTVRGNNDPQTKYFLGRDLMFVGQAERGIKLLKEITDDMRVSYEMLYAIAIELVNFYAYGCYNARPRIDHFKKENIQEVEGWCRLAMSYASEYAEPCVVLGDVYWHKGNVEAAIKMYRVALTKKIGTGKFQCAPMYYEIPAERLARLYALKKNLGMAIHYNRMVLNVNKSTEYINNRKELIQLLIEEVHNEFGTN